MSEAAPPPLDAPFRPRRGRVVPRVVAVAFVVVFGAVAVALAVVGHWGGGDVAALLAFALVVAAFVWRYSTIRAVPGRDGLVVRNLVVTRTVGWDEVVRVRFADGDPWVTLDLVDDDELAVMAVQRVDGELGQEEARRLDRLVAERRGRGVR
ncbi:PH domain-containing protein [Phycicoccus sp. CSK15P-2]|uniref:PH domain-containing protein n=1 Tax=Phycicoccus sp. CSK15P-2 TaxID=2807627 RepID=UPI00194F7ADD|nr:PH domain-containing protein [Phycicoccus sp. CSK15P-2]MBM6403767.1 PH domain-containing protein [Phycicoccus sp. CSK15P-2]